MDYAFPFVKSEDESQTYSRQGLTSVNKMLRFARQIRFGDNVRQIHQAWDDA